jgi:hypothetical protein
MDIPKKGVAMEDVKTARALHKARSNTEEEETCLFVSLYYSCIRNHIVIEVTLITCYFCRIFRKLMCFCA